MDSNHRRYNQQIYSLPHLATLVLALKNVPITQAQRADGGIRTLDPEITNHVLWPTELHRQICMSIPHGITERDCKDNELFEITKIF